jgi:hypothetical protein
MGNSFAWEIPGFSFSLPANIDMSSESTYLFTPVNVFAATGAGIDTDAACAPVAATGDPAIGILQNNPQLAEAGTIVVDGISKALLGGTVSIGQLLMATPSGGLQVATSGKYAIAQALQAGVSGQYIAVLLVHNGKI